MSQPHKTREQLIKELMEILPENLEEEEMITTPEDIRISHHFGGKKTSLQMLSFILERIDRYLDMKEEEKNRKLKAYESIEKSAKEFLETVEKKL